jgi:putative ABC transport system permease protein
MNLEAGSLWNNAFEATLGHQVAADNGLRVGDTFYSAHGTDANAEEHGDHPFTVVGVFEPSGSVIDKLILTSHESIWLVHETPGDTAALANRDLTALLVKFKNKMGIITLPRFVNQQTSMQAALPAIELNRLFGLFGVGIATLRVVAIAIMLLGAVSVFVSMINSLRERAYEMALIRSMGASRLQVFSMILLEAVFLGAGGVLGGLLLARAGIWIMNTYASAQFGMVVDIWQMLTAEWLLAAVTVLLCTFAAALPAFRTSRMDVSKVLSNYA